MQNKRKANGASIRARSVLPGWSIFLSEPFQTQSNGLSECFIHEPADDVGIMGGFGQYDRWGRFTIAPIAPNIGMTHECIQSAQDVDTDHLADHFGIRICFNSRK
jgi:hypothetical protein